MGLRTLLFVLSALAGLAGIVLIFATALPLSLVAGTLVYVQNGFVIALLKGFGIAALTIGYVLCAAARDPGRYVAVINAFIFALVCAAALNLYGLAVLGLGSLYPAWYLVIRALVALGIAIALFLMRPKAALPS